MKKLFAIIFVSLLLTGSAFAGNTYNQYGSRTGLYRTNGSTTSTCDKYGPRAKVRHINKKKQYNEKQRSKFTA